MAWVFMVVRQTPRGHPQNDIILITSHKAVSPPSRRGGRLQRRPPPPSDGRVHVRGGGDADRTQVHFMAVRVVYIQKNSVVMCVSGRMCVCVCE